MNWGALNRAMDDGQRASWNGLRHRLWETACELQSATVECGIKKQCEGQKVAGLVRVLRDEIQDMPVLEKEDEKEAGLE